MQIQSISSQNQSRQSFMGLHVIDTKVQKLLLTSLNSKQLGTLSSMIKEQENNSVNILLEGSGNRLNASLHSAYRIKDFKTEYKQIPFIESKMHFIKRVVAVANNYKQQVKDFKVCNLNWEYPVLSEWKKMMKL